MPSDMALSRYEEALSLVDEFVPDSQVMHQALQMAATHQHPVYDMVFLALAQRYAYRLLSTDSKLLALAVRIDPHLAVPDLGRQRQALIGSVLHMVQGQS